MSSARERLTRLLSLVPYLDAHPGADLEETAAYFGIDSATLIDDLELLFVTGRPGHMPDDLIDA
ncbi:WYL domain-containing protein, partial [Burkholderia multivorans]